VRSAPGKKRPVGNKNACFVFFGIALIRLSWVTLRLLNYEIVAACLPSKRFAIVHDVGSSRRNSLK
jgi:hypothetical protein